MKLANAAGPRKRFLAIVLALIAVTASAVPTSDPGGENVWDAGEWFYESLRELDVEALRDSGLKERLLEEAERDRARLVGSVQERSMRQSPNARTRMQTTELRV